MAPEQATTDTQAAILDAARQGFAARGYDRTTIRSIAAGASVDPALVMHYFGNKEKLFVAAMELPIDPASVMPKLLGDLDDQVGERVVRFFLGLIDDPESRRPLLGILRATVSSDEPIPLMREFIESTVLTGVAPLLGENGRLRANLVGSQLLGILLTRYVVCVEPLASTDADILVAAYAPTIQRYLTGDLAQ